MKHLLTTAVLIVCAVVLTLNLTADMRTFPAAISQTSQAPVHVAAFAEAQCRRDPQGLVANAADLSIEDAAPAIAKAAKCSSVRYLGHAHGSDGDQYVFVLTNADDEYETWWVYTVNDQGLVTGLR